MPRPAEMTMSVSLPDGTMTPPVPLSVVKDVVEKVKAGRRQKPPMRETGADRQVRDDAYGAAGDELRQFVERYEQLEAEKKDITGQQKEVMAEAKGRGYDTRALRQIIALRKRKPEDIAEEQAVLDIYKSALGME